MALARTLAPRFGSKAIEQEKEILIYIADDDTASFPQSVVDDDTRLRKQLAAFKRTLRERHNVDTFSTPEDLVEKLARNFKKHFVAKEQGQPGDVDSDDIFAKTSHLLKEFRLTPKRYSGHQVRLCVSFNGGVFAASRTLCQHFNLDYGFTVGAFMRVVKPADSAAGFNQIYATGNNVDALRELVQAKKGDLYAQLQFTQEDVKVVRGEFFGQTYFDDGSSDLTDPFEVYVPPEGKVILLFTQAA